MWKAFLFLACVAGYITIISCDGETNPSGETKPIEETTGGRRECGCYPPICPKNEVYYNCSGGCTPRRCSEIGFPLNCDKKCTPGCVCKQSYVRAENGTCIPISECPSCGGDKNAQQGCGNNCGHTCSTYNKPPRPCPLFCIFNGCNCRKGYVYDNNIKACVKPEDCTPICQANEQYSPCTNGGCVAKNCSQIGKPVPCIRLDPRYCIKGCTCVEGYLRASNGTCVPKDQCYPPVCPKNEVYYNCSGGCIPRRCSEIGFPLNCDKKCTPGCVCRDNYVRADNGTCIPIPQCPSCGGDKNAQQGCGNNCGHTCSSYNKPPTPCPPGCIFNGCNCRKGYVYDNNVKACVKPEDCTPICQVNEEYSDCINGGCDARNCSQIGKLGPCLKLDPKYCIKGCICVKGYLRTSNGTCVPKDQCPSCGNDPNAHPGCGVNCGRTCSTYKTKYMACILTCKHNGCDCNDGYVYDPNRNKCVLPKDCTPTCGLHEVYTVCIQGGCGRRNCTELGSPQLCRNPKSCTNGCVCAPGYLRADNGTCVPYNKCPVAAKCDKPNEVYDVCPAPCPPKRCNVNEAVIKCAAPPKPGDPDCQPGCRCADNYYRNATGTCVLKKKCEKPLPCDGPNEVYSACRPICPPQQCSINPAGLFCPRNPVYGDPGCKPSCICIKGYARNDANECIPRDKCPINCPVNEEHSLCINGGCDARNCSQVGKPVPCVKLDPKFCIKGCVCVKDYLRASNGTCVPKDQCTGCGGDPNAQRGCGYNCGKTCTTYKLKHPSCPHIRCLPNRCDCKDGYVFDGNVKKCVLPQDCTPICQVNEEYSSCVNGGCDARNCSQNGKPVPCIKLDPKYCIKGCICVKGYLRASNGTCVPKDQCSPKCDKPNEVYDVCPAPCPPKRCNVNEAVIKCAAPPKPGDPDCQPGCRCADNYYRNATGTCVLKKKCEKPLPCDGPNEVYSACRPICPPQECSINPAGLFCPRNPVYGDPGCKPSCICIEGYARNDANECIPRDKCPQNCPVNEEYSLCINGGCDARNCSQVGKPVPCVKLDPKFCNKGCVCVKDYLRASNGTCVPKDECTGCGGDPNAQPGCGYNCGTTCSTFKIKHPICPRIRCIPNRCDCKDGYVFDGNIKKCVLPQDCTPICQVNEEYSSCVNGGCDARNCSQNGKPVPCIKLDPKYCIKGCICIKGYLRASNGTCVPKDQCTPKCDKPNEVYDVCPAPCPPKRCDVNEALIKCKAPPKPGDPDCQPGCRCADNYYRNATGTCVPKKKCEKPLICDRPNEIYDACGIICPSQECGANPAASLCLRPPEYGDPSCKPSCVCIDGYARNDKKECIPRDKCPQNCPVNEEYSLCINGGCDARNCSQIGKPVPCVKLDPKSCIKGCVCVKDYLRASNGTCVPKDQCSSKCDKPNEVYDVCPAPCPPKRCNVNEAVIKCAAPPKPGDPDCQPGCRCADNYYRNATGTCVPKNKCEKPLICARPNEVYDACGIICPPQECGVNPALILCLPNPKYGDPSCKPSCVCIDGYVRNDDGECIPRDKCPKCDNPNEVYDVCPAPCPPKWCNVNETVINCAAPPKPGKPNCQPGCRCADNYYRNATGTCVLKKQCEKPLPCDGPNEVYSACPPICPPQDCHINSAVILCPRNPVYGDPGCKPSCICINGYVRNDAKECIPKDKCPYCTGQNEYWEPCIQGCSNQTCGSINQTYFCPFQKGCKSGCRCHPGFYRNDDNLCVPEKECPKTCGKNEHYEECYYSCGGNETCDDIGKKYNCPAQRKCYSGCRCDKGYWRNADKVCIPENQCPNPCGKNEYWEPCIKGCGNQSCIEVGSSSKSCPAQIVGQCPYGSGCRCKPKFYRNSDGVCIPESECPKCYGKNEIWVNCIQGCSNQSCDDIGKIFQCPNEPAGQCRSGCRCEPGTWRNAFNVCVPQEECPKPDCPNGEIWNWCPTIPCDGDYCPKTKDSPQSCPIGIICDKPRCVCEINKKRDWKTGKCIEIKDCPKCYGKNEVWVNCIQGCSNQSCDDIGKIFHCPKEPAGECRSGCRCEPGTWRNASNVCVPQEECPKPDCPNGEIWNWCPTIPCDGDYCPKTKDSPQTCPIGIVCDKPRCVCEINKKRDWKTGKCIEIKDCPKCYGKNEVWVNCIQGCSNQSCDDIGKIFHCPKEPAGECRSGCRCEPGTWRNASNVCVPQEECPKPDCPNGEIWNWCPTIPCDGDYCPKTKDSPQTCPIGIVCDKPRCVCEINKKRDWKTGKCIEIKDCPKCYGKNEVWVNCIQGCSNQSCDDIGKIFHCPKEPAGECRSGCRCEPGTWRNASNVCVPQEECPKPDCPNGEIWNWCPTIPCDGDYCPKTKDSPQTCPIGIVCDKPRCVCEINKKRDWKTGKCIEIKDCPKCYGKNEVWVNCIQGCSNQSCDDIGKIFHCPKEPAGECRSGCRCEPGTWRNASNVCVPQEECPKPDCPNGEIWNWCPTIPCDGDYCPKTKDSPQTCPIGIVCDKPRCVCEINKKRDWKTGKCIEIKDCPKCYGKNEVWVNCIQGCSNQSCDDIGKIFHCPKEPAGECRSGCRCEPGTWRNASNVCVPQEECPKPDCPNGEIWNWCPTIPCDGDYCPKTKDSPQTCPIGIVCDKPRCVCEINKKRDWKTGKCIEIKDCPKCYGKNEVWVNCIQGCSNQSCDDIGKIFHCPKEPAGECRSGCRCEPGTWRNASNVCVPQEECPKPDCPNGEIWNWCPTIPCDGDYCPKTKDSPQTCPIGIVCDKPRCVCEINKKRDWKTGKCIEIKDCPKCYGKNEVWVNCIQGCSNQSCDDIGKIFHCPKEPAGECRSGCRCEPGTWRNASNVCVPQEECPKPDCPNGEIWNWCPTIPCDGDYCPKTKDSPQTCPIGIVCDKPRCVCEINKKRDWKTGKCIEIKDCPKCYGKNEVWVNCIQGCSNQSCDDIGKIFHCPKEPAGECRSGCRCEPGTWRNASNVCVPQEECPKPGCPNGEVWSWCPAVPCDGDYCPKTKDSPQSCLIGIACEKPRCVCESNKKRDWKTGKCIRIQDCPKFKCECNEEYQACPPPCPGETCSDYINGLGSCPPYKSICRPQCRCIKDYYRHANGTCIPACDCPKKIVITTTEPPTTSGRGTGLRGILDGITAFTGLCLYNRMKSAPSENIILSAMSVFTPVAELCLYSKGPAYDQCIKLLNLKDKQDIRDTFPKLDASLGGQTTVNISIASKVYSAYEYKLNDSFKKDAVDVFNASAEELNFSKNKEAADIINAWVQSKTNNRIQDLVTPNMFSPLTRLVLVNAIYFKGTWLYTFNKNNTKEENFYLNDGTTKKIQLMGQVIQDLDYGEIPSLDCRAVRVYYKGKTSSMIIVLPNTINGTLNLAKNLQDPTNWKKVTDSFSPQKVQLYLPLFKITTTTDLKELLKKANIIDWFNSENSGLEGILAKPEPVYITEALQKAFVEVNEEGAEAAAANAVVVSTRSLPLPPPVIKEFKANRAFLYYLEIGSVVAFCGAFNG